MLDYVALCGCVYVQGCSCPENSVTIPNLCDAVQSSSSNQPLSTWKRYRATPFSGVHTGAGVRRESKSVRFCDM